MAEPRLAAWVVASVVDAAATADLAAGSGGGRGAPAGAGWPALAAARAAAVAALATAGADGTAVDLVILAVDAFPDPGAVPGRSAALLDNAVNAAVHRELLLGAGLPTAVPLGVQPGPAGLTAALWTACCAVRADDAGTVLVLGATRTGPVAGRATGVVVRVGPGRPVRAAYGPDEAVVLAELVAPAARRLVVPGPADLPPGELLLVQHDPAGTGAVHVAP